MKSVKKKIEKFTKSEIAIKNRMQNKIDEIIENSNLDKIVKNKKEKLEIKKIDEKYKLKLLPKKLIYTISDK